MNVSHKQFYQITCVKRIRTMPIRVSARQIVTCSSRVPAWCLHPHWQCPRRPLFLLSDCHHGLEDGGRNIVYCRHVHVRHSRHQYETPAGTAAQTRSREGRWIVVSYRHAHISGWPEKDQSLAQLQRVISFMVRRNIVIIIPARCHFVLKYWCRR